jgi:hypothetical protein
MLSGQNVGALAKSPRIEVEYIESYSLEEVDQAWLAPPGPLRPGRR